ncbi:MAG: heavy metal translocating P-type ATPase [Candidatus Schekmanbacteria bacterium]|nr:heavy metal translocating P-type ATPase [Candidatus Schekmanbacteria bacterium]
MPHSTDDSQDSRCAHCRLPVPPALLRAGAGEQFCCQGCRTVHAVLHEHGLERYYELAAEADPTPRPPDVSGRSFAELDSETFRERYCTAVPGGLRAVELYLEGVHCIACLWLLENLGAVVAGVGSLRLDFGRAVARVVWNPDEVALSAIARMLDRMGYLPHPYRARDLHALRRRENRALLARIGVAGAAAGNVMLLSVALYAGLFTGIDPELRTLFRWTSLAVSLPASLWAGSVFFRNALAALRVRRVHMDIPIAIGIAAGLAGGAVNTVSGTGEIYFDSIMTLVFLLLVGRWLQLRAQRRAAEITERRLSLVPSSARLVVGDEIQEVLLEALVPGALVEVRAGETVPADGTVSSGETELDASMLTGESAPRVARAADTLLAGMINLSGAIRMRVDAAGEETRVGRLLASVAEHQRRRAPIVSLADRVSGYFVAVVLVAAVLTFLAWWEAGGPAVALDRALALLIVTCPCALGMATPLAVSAALGKAAAAGILIRGGDALESLSRCGRMWLDKTGTLTEGKLRLESWVGADAVLRRLRRAEAESAHPIAAALRRGAGAGGPADIARAAGMPEPELSRCEQVLGAGLRATVDGRELVAGSPAFVAGEIPGAFPAWVDACVRAAAAAGQTPVVVAESGIPEGVAVLADALHADAEEMVARLGERGWQVGILSGDHPEAVKSVAATLGIARDEAFGGLTPEQKRDVVARGGDGGVVVMVGDGINDAAALGAAQVGISVHGGAEASLQAADVFLQRPGLRPIIELLDGARRSLGAVRRNLAISLLYNLVAGALAMSGLIHPLIAAVLMPLSSLTVVSLSFRARTFEAAAERSGRRAQ